MQLLALWLLQNNLFQCVKLKDFISLLHTVCQLITSLPPFVQLWSLLVPKTQLTAIHDGMDDASKTGAHKPAVAVSIFYIQAMKQEDFLVNGCVAKRHL